MQNITFETLAKTPAFAAAMRDLEAVQLAERQAQIDALAAFRVRWHADLAALDAKAQSARREADELRARAMEVQQDADAANSALLWNSTRATEQDRRLEAAIMAGADPRLAQFAVWAARAANLAAVATFEPVVAFSGAAAPATNARQSHEVSRLCAEANARADRMRREAIAADDVSLELDAMAAGIVRALDRLGGSAAARLPRDWRNPLI